MNRKKLISVIIPTYNRAHFIHEAVESALNQDIQGYDLEVLVIDDGSTDNTCEVLKAYGDSIRYIHQENGGAGVARNRGLQEARGEWITFLDSDDLWLPHRLSLQMAVLERIPECKVLFGNFLVSENGQIILEDGVAFWAEFPPLSHFKDWKEMFSSSFDSGDIGVTHQGRTFSIYRGNIFGGQIFQPCISCCTTIIARECITESIRFAEGWPTWEDVWFTCRLLEDREVYYMDVVIYENRGHAGPRLTHAEPIKSLQCHIKICDEIYFPSTSPHRPDDATLKTLYAILHKELFKEYLKKGQHDEATEVKRRLKEIGFVPKDIPYLLYCIGYLVPGNPIHQLVRIKHLIEGR